MADELIGIIKNCLSSEATDRKNAETIVLSLYTVPAIPCKLMQIVCDQNIEQPIRIMASIIAKNIINIYWDPITQHYSMPADEKSTIREEIFDVICRVRYKLIQNQLLEIISTIAKCDFPANWNSIMPRIAHELQSGDHYIILASLRAIKAFLLIYNQESGSGKAPLEIVISYTFGQMLSLLQRCDISDETHAAIAHKIMNNLVRSKGKSRLDVMFSNEITLSSLVTITLSFILHDCNETKNYYWKAKISAAKLICFLFQRCNNTTNTSYNERILVAVLKSLQQYNHPNKYSASLLKLLTSAIKNKLIYSDIKLSIQLILANIAFPLLNSINNDFALWFQNQSELIKSLYCEQLPYPELKSAICNMLNELFTVTIDGVTNLMAFYKLLTDGLSHSQNNLQVIDTVLIGFGSLDDYIKEHQQEFNSSTETLLKVQIYPILLENTDLLQMRAAWLFNKLCFIKFEDSNFRLSLFTTMIKHMCDKSKALPVRIACSIAIESYFKIEELQETVKCNLSQITTSYIDIIKAIDLEEAVDSFRSFLKVYAQFIKPYSLALIKELSHHCYNALIECKDNKENTESTYIAASSLMVVVKSLISLIKDENEALKEAEPFVLPICRDAFTLVLMDIVPCAINIIGIIMQGSHILSSSIWELYPIIIDCLVSDKEEEGGWLYDSILLIEPLLICYMSHSDEFVNLKSANGESHCDMMLRLVKSIIRIYHNTNSDKHIIRALKLVNYFLKLQNEIIYSTIPSIISMLIQEYNREVGNHIVISLCMCFYNNPIISINYMKQSSCILLFTNAIKAAIEDKSKEALANSNIIMLALVAELQLLILDTATIQGICQLLKSLIALKIQQKKEINNKNNEAACNIKRSMEAIKLNAIYQESALKWEEQLSADELKSIELLLLG